MVIFSLLENIDSYNNILHGYIRHQIKDHPINMFESHEGIDLMSLDMLDMSDEKAAPAKVTICMTDSHLLFLCENDTVLDRIKSTLSVIDDLNASESSVLCSFFSELTKNDIDVIESIDDELNSLEGSIVEYRKTDRLKDIRRSRNRIRAMRKYYDQLSFITGSLCENSNALIPDNIMRRVEILDSRISMLSTSIKELREYSTQVREAYQSQIDIEQNSIMKVFTIISGIFLPLTLLVGWYGMNFAMPEFGWRYGYPAVIIAGAAIVIICIAFFKKKKWM